MAQTHVAPESWTALSTGRRSIRDFRDEPVPAPLLDEILSDALSAPSWSNTQPFRIGVASGEVRDSISAALCSNYDRAMRLRRGSLLSRARLAASRLRMPPGDYRVPLEYPPELQERRRATGHGLYEVLGIERSDRAGRDLQMRRNFEFFGAPTALFVFTHEGLGEYSVLDAGAMLQTLMLAAHVRGLGTCAQGALALWSGPVREAFVVPEHYRLLCGVAIGYASDAPVNAYAPRRRQVDDVLLPTRA